MIARVKAFDPERIDWLAALFLLIVSQLAIWTGPSTPARVGMAIWVATECCALAMRRRWLLQWVSVALVVAAVLLAIYGSVVLRSAGTLAGVIGSLSALLLFYGGSAFLEGRRSRLALGLGVVLVSVVAAASAH